MKETFPFFRRDVKRRRAPVPAHPETGARGVQGRGCDVFDREGDVLHREGGVLQDALPSRKVTLPFATAQAYPEPAT